MENPVENPLKSGGQVPGAGLGPRVDLRLGLVVPKRMARRSVTRNLIRRQMRAVVSEQLRQGHALVAGDWVLRLRSPFDPVAYPSAASAALRRAARAELQDLLLQAWRRSAPKATT